MNNKKCNKEKKCFNAFTSLGTKDVTASLAIQFQFDPKPVNQFKEKYMFIKKKSANHILEH